MITVRGVVLSSRVQGESDRYISLMTAEKGVIDVLARGACKQNSSNNASTQLLAYGDFCIDEKKGRYYLNSSKVISVFYGIRNDIVKVALAEYIAELVRYSVMSEQTLPEIMRLVLNTYSFLADDRLETKQLKAIFELRLMCCLGHTPALVGCAECFRFEDTENGMYFDFGEAKLYCTEHFDTEHHTDGYMLVDNTVLHCVRLVCLSEFERIFSFRVRGNALDGLAELSQRFVLAHLVHRFRTLEFYNSLCDTE